MTVSLAYPQDNDPLSYDRLDGELTIGEVTEKDYFRIEGTDMYMRGIDAPPDFWECGDYEEQSKIIKRNMRAILQLFNIRVIIFPDRVEIKGTIPQQVLYRGEAPEPATALFISSASPLSRGRYKTIKHPLQTTNFSWL